MACKHERAHLMGTADGIICRACGKMWPDFAAYEAETAPPAETKAEPAPVEAPVEEKKAPEKKTASKKAKKEE